MNLFRDDADYTRFLSLLVYSLAQSGCELWAYVLMTNHYHLVLHGSSDQLTACMRRLGTRYSLYHNQRYGLNGHAFDGPYQAYRQRTALLSMWTIAYVFLNPVKAGLCSRPEDYPWSGYRSFLGLPGSPVKVDVSSLQPEIDLDPRKAWGRFRDAMRREAQRPYKQVQGRLTMVEVHIQQFGWFLDYAAQHPVPSAGIEVTDLAMYWARQCGVSPKAMAHVLSMEETGPIRKRLRAVEERCNSEPGLRDLLAVP